MVNFLATEPSASQTDAWLQKISSASFPQSWILLQMGREQGKVKPRVRGEICLRDL